MADNDTSRHGGISGQLEGDPEASLAMQEEIQFWQEMIDTRGDCLPPDAVERMHHAKALAEWRLAQLRETAHPAFETDFYFDQARRKSR